MSTASCLLLFFLCISLHACYARHFSPLNMKLQEKSHFSIKIDEKNGFDSRPKHLNEGLNKTEARLVGESEKPRNRRSTNHRVHKAVKNASGALKKSLVSVSWRVPHNKKPRQKHPGFDLDYSPPKTHPPHHN
ncbi:unnamed protein product [Sphenostylis stenocarpa]|uniref:Uncharacterized protein n=1 Tax=Sphenostylis stenocarpa TaxID=92480 RepID=A0AA86VB14_9FABA|nr:unnamed protein product [Sphenostylis stenocarpa]